MIRRGYVRISSGQVHFRSAGQGPPVVLLHYSFLNSRMHTALIEHLADTFTVVALDTPGYGASEPLALGCKPRMEDFADALAETIDQLGFEAPTVFGSYAGAKLGLACAARHPGKIGFLICDSLAASDRAPSEDYIAHYMEPFVIGGDGAYIASAWTMMRDFRRFYPWFEPTAAHRMMIDQPSLQDDHSYALSLLTAGPTYTDAYEAALRYDPLPALKTCRTPAVFLARESSIMARVLDKLRPHLPSGAFCELTPSDEALWTERLRAILVAHAKGREMLPLPAPPPGRDPERAVVSMAHGDVEVRLFGLDRLPVVLALHDPPGAASSLDPLCGRLADHRRVIAPDLPGCNLSDPLPAPSVDAYVGVLLGVLDRFDAPRVDLLAEGLSTPLALALAARAPSRIGHIVLNAASLLGVAEREVLTDRYCPAIVPTRQGGYTLEVWQRVRDMELQWPWYAETRSAIRKVDPKLDAVALHRRLLAILSQIEHYGDACAAALSIDALSLLSEIVPPVTVLTRVDDPRYPEENRLPATVRALAASSAADGATDRILSALLERSER